MWPLPKREMEFNCRGSVSAVARRLQHFHYHMYREWWDTPECDPATGAPIRVRFQFIPENGHKKYHTTYFPIVTGILSPGDRGTVLKIIMRCDFRTELTLWIWIGACVYALVHVGQMLLANPGLSTITPCIVIIFMLLGAPALIWYLFFLESEDILKVLRKYI